MEKLPFRVKSTAELERRAENYFKSCKGVQMLDEEGELMFDKSGNPMMEVPERPLTVTGLALALGFSSRRELLEFSGKKRYMDVIDRALAKIECFAEEKLFDKGQYSGAKFFLANNFSGWSDKPEPADSSVEKLDEVLRRLSEVMDAK